MFGHDSGQNTHGRGHYAQQKPARAYNHAHLAVFIVVEEGLQPHFLLQGRSRGGRGWGGGRLQERAGLREERPHVASSALLTSPISQMRM